MHKLPVVAALVFAAVCMNFSWTHDFHDGDSLMMSLISIDRYLPFYWGDNRYGMLVPWLAQWVRDYRWNLLFQAQLHAFALVGVVLVFHWLLRRTAATAALSLAIAIPMFRADARVILPHLMGAPYHTSMLFGLLGVALIFRTRGALRYPAAALLFVLSFWVNFSSAFFIAGLLLLLPEDRGAWRERGLAIALALVALLGVRWFAAFYPQLGGAALVSPAVAWKSTLNLVYMSFTHVLYPARVALLCAGAVWMSWQARVMPGKAPLVFLAVSAAFAISVASTDWVVKNLWEPRYWTSAISFAVLVFASVLAARIVDRLTPRHRAPVAAFALAIVSVAVFGLPSPARALAGIDRSSGVRWKEVQALGCTHMVGFFSQAWSSVFYAKAHNLPSPLYPLAPRGEVLGDAWRKVPQSARVYCGLCGDSAINTALVEFGVGPLDTVATMGELCRYAHPAPR